MSRTVIGVSAVKLIAQPPIASSRAGGYRVPNGGLFSTVNDLARFIAWELGDGPAGILPKAVQDANYGSESEGFVRLSRAVHRSVTATCRVSSLVDSLLEFW